MENQKQNKLGAGIITISVIQIIFSVFALIGSIILLIPSFQENLATITGAPLDKLGIDNTSINSFRNNTNIKKKSYWPIYIFISNCC